MKRALEKCRTLLSILTYRSILHGFCICKFDYLQNVFVTPQTDTQRKFTVIYKLI